MLVIPGARGQRPERPMDSPCDIDTRAAPAGITQRSWAPSCAWLGQRHHFWNTLGRSRPRPRAGRGGTLCVERRRRARTHPPHMVCPSRGPGARRPEHRQGEPARWCFQLATVDQLGLCRAAVSRSDRRRGQSPRRCCWCCPTSSPPSFCHGRYGQVCRSAVERLLSWSFHP